MSGDQLRVLRALTERQVGILRALAAADRSVDDSAYRGVPTRDGGGI